MYDLYTSFIINDTCLKSCQDDIYFYLIVNFIDLMPKLAKNNFFISFHC